MSDWIENNVFLPEGTSSLPGEVRLWKFQRSIADAIGDPEIERVTLVKPVRVGFSTLLTSAIGHFCANDPAPILSVLPTEADCRDYVVSDVEPIFEASPELSGLLSGDIDEGGRNTLLSRRFPGGSLKVVAAKAPRNLRRHNVRVLFIDEADAMEVTKEGSPIPIAERRTMSFPDRKIVLGSTPIFESTSHVLRAYAQSDQRVFEVPCPGCGGLTEILWRHIEWEEGRPETASFRCPRCEQLIAERFKVEMVEKGEWRPTAAHVLGHAGFRMNALVSPHANASWAKLATEFLTARSDPSLLQTFVNTILAEGWREGGEELDDAELSSRAEPFWLQKAVDGKELGPSIPDAATIVTAGVDVQPDRLEITFVGWSEDGTAWILGHTVVWGQWDDDTTWAELDEVLTTRWTHPLGGKIGLDAVAIDSSDGNTMEAVYAFAFPRFRKKILAIKGVAGTRPWIERSRSKVKGDGFLWIVGVDGVKSAVFGRLMRGHSIRFSETLETAWFEQLASERVVVRYVRGQPTRRFERIPGRRAEALDCVVYAFAARQIVNVNWARRAEELSGAEVSRPRKSRELWPSYR